MPDLWEGDMDASDFALPGDEATMTAQAEAATVVEEAPPEEEAVETVERPRDEQGRFVAEQPEETEDETPQEAVERLFANKYQSPEELERGYLELQARLSQRDERAALADQYEQYFQQQQAQPQPQQQFAPIGDWETLIEDDPARAAQLAAEQQNPHAFDAAMQAWNEVSPGTPQVWYDNQILKAQLGQVGEQMGQVANQEAERETAQRIGALLNEYPDLPDRVPAMQEIAAQYPYELRAMVQGSPEERAAATKSLYLKTLGLDRETLAQTAQETVRKLAQDELAAVEAAGVVSASRTNPQSPASTAEAIAASWADEDRRFNDGWNIT